jgi:CheY-like chemotaxis protein
MPRVLLADDDSTQLEVQARLLETGGHQVSLAFCPAETLRLLPTADVVVMDLRFRNTEGEPDVREGLSLIRRIRESGCRKPVIVVSGWPEEIQEAPEGGMVSRVMIKPVRIAVLLAAIAELLI